jgi:predicted DNA-binding transcriptional regulator AlpA
MPYRELDQWIYHVYNRGFEKQFPVIPLHLVGWSDGEVES